MSYELYEYAKRAVKRASLVAEGVRAHLNEMERKGFTFSLPVISSEKVQNIFGMLDWGVLAKASKPEQGQYRSEAKGTIT